MSFINLNFPFDYVVIIISVLIVIFSAWRGFIQSILGLLTWIGSIIITLYSYASFSEFLNKQILKISFFQSYETLSFFISTIISIPLIFLISLFFLKRLRKILSSDLDKQIFGVIIDKFFGIVYGIVFSYFIFSTIIFCFKKFNLNNLNDWITYNSEIINQIDIFNEKYIYELISYEEINEL